MKAVVFPNAQAISIEQVADPTPQPDEVVVQVTMSGICGTDLHIYHNEYMSQFPLIPGHEFGGHIVALGSAVTGLASRNGAAARFSHSAAISRNKIRVSRSGMLLTVFKQCCA